MLAALRNLNRYPIYEVTDAAFAAYGRVLTADCTELHTWFAEHAPIPEQNNVYVAANASLAALPVIQEIAWQIYGGLPMQAGYCNGHTHRLSALEWHNGSEVNYAQTPLVLLLATQADIHGNRVDSASVKAFYLPAGTLVEIYSGTLHFAPCAVQDAGFRCLVCLPEGTNTPLPADCKRSEPLRMHNKWMLCHAERPDLIAAGAREGIDGENIVLSYPE